MSVLRKNGSFMENNVRPVMSVFSYSSTFQSSPVWKRFDKASINDDAHDKCFTIIHFKVEYYDPLSVNGHFLGGRQQMISLHFIEEIDVLQPHHCKLIAFIIAFKINMTPYNFQHNTTTPKLYDCFLATLILLTYFKREYSFTRPPCQLLMSPIRQLTISPV